MIEQIEQYLAWFANHGGLVAWIIGSLVGWTATLALERYFLPTARSDDVKRNQQGLTFVFCWLACGTFTAILWWALDADTRASVRLAVSYVTGALPFTLYPILARIATKKVPEIGTAWAKHEGE